MGSCLEWPNKSVNTYVRNNKIIYEALLRSFGDRFTWKWKLKMYVKTVQIEKSG